MRLFIFLALCLGSQLSFALETDVIEKLVREDISQGKVISGKRSVETLKFVTCEETTCALDFTYFTSGCYQDMCWDLECSGKIGFDLEEIDSWLIDQTCSDL